MKTGCCILKTIGIIIGVILLVAIVVGLIVPAIAYAKNDPVKTFEGLTNKYINYTDRIYISAHRAGGDLAPEETMMAFEKCMEGGIVDVVEFDLHITKDDQLVLMHDSTVNRTSNATEVFGNEEVYVIDKTLEELKTLNFGAKFEDLEGNKPYAELTGDSIPENIKIVTLDEILTYLTGRKSDLQYIIEIKNDGEPGKKAMDILASKMDSFGIIDQTIVGTFNKDITEYIDEEYPEITRSASIMEVVDFYFSYLFGVKSKRTFEYKFDVLQIPVGTFIYDFGASSFINYAHERNIAVQYWTINDPDEALRLKENGADCVMTDDPETIYAKYHESK